MFADSQTVAATFEKEHRNMLRDIDAPEAHGSVLSRGFFTLRDTPHPHIAGRLDRSFDMGRDGFALLAMGFTGAADLSLWLQARPHILGSAAIRVPSAPSYSHPSAPSATPSLPVLRAVEGRAVANSREVAAAFEKRHDNVLRDIDSLIATAPECALKFEATSDKVAMPQGGIRTSRSFDMDRDGFALLAMGFTGAKALRFKLAYIEAFNRMEAELRGVVKVAQAGTSGAGPFLTLAAVPPKERISIAGNTLENVLGIPVPRNWAIFLTRTGVNLLLMTSTKPNAKACRDWLAGDVVNAIVDTGGYLLNEAARNTAKADTRTSVPLPVAACDGWRRSAAPMRP